MQEKSKSNSGTELQKSQYDISSENDSINSLDMMSLKTLKSEPNTTHDKTIKSESTSKTTKLSIDKSSDEYKEKRKRNNEAVRKSRILKKNREIAALNQAVELQRQNSQLTQEINHLKSQIIYLSSVMNIDCSQYISENLPNMNDAPHDNYPSKISKSSSENIPKKVEDNSQRMFASPSSHASVSSSLSVISNYSVHNSVPMAPPDTAPHQRFHPDWKLSPMPLMRDTEMSKGIQFNPQSQQQTYSRNISQNNYKSAFDNKLANHFFSRD